MQAQATDKKNTITTSPKDIALKGGSHLCAFKDNINKTLKITSY